MQIVSCRDFTCKNNADGICKAETVYMGLDANAQNEICNICESYENRGDSDAGND